MRATQRTLSISLGLMVATCALAQAPIVYPAKKQTAEQQKKDEGECAAWAKQTTGVDPVALASAPATSAAAPTAAPPPEAEAKGPKGERVRGAARGALAGAAVGEIADNDAGKGAAVGATVGAVAAGGRERRAGREKQEQAAEQQQQAAADQKAADQAAEAKKQEQLATYSRANAACLEGRGYVLK